MLGMCIWTVNLIKFCFQNLSYINIKLIICHCTSRICNRENTFKSFNVKLLTTFKVSIFSSSVTQ